MSADDDIAHAGVLGQAGMLRDGRLSSTRLVDLLLARIGRLDPHIRAFRIVLADSARAAAREADESRARGDARPLLGVPIAIKDTVAVTGTATMLGTGSPEPTATTDDELVRRLRAAGMVILGKTQLPELALWAATESETHGITRNPWHPAFVPGGSSGGSAAAVAAGMVPAAHATDGLGSIRIPASACGLVGLKPTHGLVPPGPDPDHWAGMSHTGFLTRSVRDTAALLDAIVDSALPAQSELALAVDTAPPPLRIAATTRGLTPTPLDRQVHTVFELARSLLRRLGHQLVDRAPHYGATLPAANTARYLSGLADDLSRLADPRATEHRTRVMAAWGRRLPPRAVSWGRDQGERFGRRMAAFFDDVDLLLTPTMPVLPRRAGCLAGRGTARTLALMAPCASFTGPWNACGLPAVNLPIGTAAPGVPVGVQLVGPPDSEALLLGLAASLEPLAGWLDRRADPNGIRPAP